MNRGDHSRSFRVSTGGSEKVIIDQRKVPTVEKHFASLGKFAFRKGKPAVITVSNEGTSGFVAVDAVQWVEAK